MKKNNFAFRMTLPSLIMLAILTLFPIIFILIYSFTDYYYLSNDSAKFIALENFKNIIEDEYFRQALYNTIKFTILAIILETTLGLLMAVFVNSFKRGNKILRILILLPTLLPPVTVALIWQIMFSNNNGIINEMLGAIGINPINWLMDTRTAFYVILTIDVWQYSPFAFLLIYAALQSVSENQYEAAKIDGANFIHRFIYITIPNIAKVVGVVVMLRTIDSFRLFDKVNILTKGGPANTTATITQYIYQHGVKGLKVGYASAASVIMTLTVLLLSGIYIWKSFKKEVVIN